MFISVKNVAIIAATAAVLPSAFAIDECSQYSDCGSCVGSSFCGWCSPAPIVYSNGSKGARCGDQRDSPWTCDHLYQTTKCVAGYVCDQDKGQCVLTTPGKGDTKENCEKTCAVNKKYRCDWTASPPQCLECSKNSTEPGCSKYQSDCSGCQVPETLYQCNDSTKTCEACEHAYCTKDSDCPGSYCQTTGFGPYTCHGSKCGKKSQCEDTCNNNVPTELLGVWRGLEISTKYTSGEFDFKFQQAAPQVTVKDNTGKQLTGSVTASALTRTLALKLSDGSTWNGMYKPWEQEPETEDFAFAFTKAGVAAPTSIVTAMNGGDYFVMSMTKCLKGASNCTFASVFDSIKRRRGLRVIDNAIVRDNAEPTTDPCNQYKSCDTCLNAPSNLCGWCDDEVEYANSSIPGAHCAGFNSEGKASPAWECKVRYRRESCHDFGCNWTNPVAPTCYQLSGNQSGMTKDTCKAGCTPIDALYRCSNTTFQCEACDVKYCNKDAECPGSYCQIDRSKPGPYTCHNGIPDGCISQKSCDASCSLSIAGVWRGVQINSGFKRGEYDVTFYKNGTVAAAALSGDTFKGAVEIGDQASVKEGTAISVTLEDGTKYSGLFELDTKGDDGIIEILSLAVADEASAPASFDQGMAAGGFEFVLFGCADGSSNCDFGASKVNA